MLRATSAVSLVTWLSLLVGLTIVSWPLSGLTGADMLLYGIVLLVSAIGVFLSFVMLLRNRPFFLGLSFFISVLGLWPGLVGLGFLFYSVGTLDRPIVPATPHEWFFAVTLSLMLVPPINWAILWRDYRHDLALRI
jgi:hypothetical protein